MNDIAVFFNALLYCLLFLITWKKNKTIGTSEVLLLIYVAVSIAGIFYYYDNPHIWDLNPLYFLYLFVIFFIFFKPVMCDNRIEVTNNPLTSPNLYKKIAVLYIILALYSCIIYIPQVYLILKNPEWADLYSEAHEEIEGNIYTKIANLFFHFRYLGLVLFFSFLAQKDVSKFFLFILGIASFLPVLLVTIKSASRGGIVALAGSIYLTYSLFKKILSPEIRKNLRTIAVCLIPMIFIYFMAVTISRFGDNLSTGYDSSESSLLSYLGQSMLYFNYGVMDSTTEYAWGGYMFDKSDAVNQIRGSHFGYSFITFIGTLYIDYGPLGTFLLAIAASNLMKRMIKTRRYGIPELFLTLYYLMYLFNGVFVNGLGYGYQWLETIIIYLLLKLAGKTSRNNYVEI